VKKQEKIYFKTGNTLLDLVVGGSPNVYGYPTGKFINIVGDKSAGKTFLANEIIASAYHAFDKKKFKWVYDDCEAGYSFNSKEMYGVDIIKDSYLSDCSSTVVEAFVNITNFAESLKQDQFGIYVIDSLDGLTSEEQDERAKERVKTVNAGKNYNKGSYGVEKPKYLSEEFFPQLCSLIQDKNILVIIISQVRENIQPFSFEKYKRSGGKAMDFYAHTVLWLATLKKINKKGKPIGVVVKAKTTKSKTPRPFRDCQFSIIFDYGIDNIGSNIDYLYELRTDKGELTPAAKNISWGSGEYKKPKLSELKKFLETQEMSYLNKSYLNKKTVKRKTVNALEWFILTYNIEKPNINSLIDHINESSDLKFAYEKVFSGGNKIFSRDDLIDYIEKNGLESELEKKVIEKWESIESDIASKRKKRYATAPRGEE